MNTESVPPTSATAKPRLPFSLRMRMAQIRPQDVPRRPDIPCTADSIARAITDAERERQECTRLTGLRFASDGRPIVPLADL